MPLTPCSTANMEAARSNDGQWTVATLPASSRIGEISPSDSILRPVTLPIWPTRIDSEMPAKKPTRIGRDRKVANTPSPSSPRAEIHPAHHKGQHRRGCDAVARRKPRRSARTAAMTVIVAASGPTMSCRDGPKIA